MELAIDQSNTPIPKEHSTIQTYERYINRHVLPRWEAVPVSEMEAIAIQDWFGELRRVFKLSNPTLVKTRHVMVAIFTDHQPFA